MEHLILFNDTLLSVLTIVVSVLIYGLIYRGLKAGAAYTAHLPQGITPAEARFALTGDLENRDIIALLFYWAQQGFLVFAQGYQGKSIIKKSEMSSASKPYERKMFFHLFSDYDRGNELSFFDIKGRLFALLFRITVQVKKSFARQDIFSSVLTAFILAVATLFSILPYFYLILQITRTASGQISSGGLLAASLVSLFFALPNSLYSFTLKKWLQNDGDNRMGMTVWSVLIFLSSTGIMAFVVSSLGFPLFALYKASFFVIMQCLFLALLRKHLPSRHKLYQQILGFNNYLANKPPRSGAAGKTPKDPSLYERYLPYAIALGVAEKWGQHFQGRINAAPTWFHWYESKTFDPREFGQYLDQLLPALTEDLAPNPTAKGDIGVNANMM